jgi:hypothetical protein
MFFMLPLLLMFVGHAPIHWDVHVLVDVILMVLDAVLCVELSVNLREPSWLDDALPEPVDQDEL